MDNSSAKHYDGEHGIRLPIITSKRYHRPFSSDNPKPMRRHIDVSVFVWEELMKMKAELRKRSFSDVIKYLVRRERERTEGVNKSP